MSGHGRVETSSPAQRSAPAPVHGDTSPDVELRCGIRPQDPLDWDKIGRFFVELSTNWLSRRTSMAYDSGLVQIPRSATEYVKTY